MILRGIQIDSRFRGNDGWRGARMDQKDLNRCPWAVTEIGISYHDREWGVPVHDDRVLFEFLVLEGAQAGLSWETILKKRAEYRVAFAGFDPAQVAHFDQRHIQRLLANPGIVRNRLKVSSAVENARKVLEVQKEFGSLNTFLWRFVNGRPKKNAWRAAGQVPARTSESDVVSRELIRHGFRFTGSTICYAFMQAVGMVNDHLVSCFRYHQIR